MTESNPEPQAQETPNDNLRAGGVAEDSALAASQAARADAEQAKAEEEQQNSENSENDNAS